MARFTASVILALALGAALPATARAENKYDQGASDSEIRIGQAMSDDRVRGGSTIPIIRRRSRCGARIHARTDPSDEVGGAAHWACLQA